MSAKSEKRFKVGERVKGALGYLHEPCKGVIVHVRENSVYVRWDEGGSLQGPADIFVSLESEA